MPVRFQDILEGFEFVNLAGGLHRAILCRRTGKIYQHAEASDLEEFNEELPDDVGDKTEYIDIPGKRELGLGKPLALDFAYEFLPDDFDDVRHMFNRSGAYRNFRALITRRSVLDRWYEFEAKATERALREWCADNLIDVVG